MFARRGAEKAADTPCEEELLLLLLLSGWIVVDVDVDRELCECTRERDGIQRTRCNHFQRLRSVTSFSYTIFELTGITVGSTPNFLNSSTSSPPLPNTNGSPVNDAYTNDGVR